MNTLDLSATRLVHAPADRIYAQLTDVTNLGRLSPENTSSRWLGAGDGAVVGRRFRGTNQVGWLRWSTTPAVTVAEPGRRFAFRVPTGALSTWTYDLLPTDDGTLVTESIRTERAIPAVVRWLMRTVGVTDRAKHLRAGMTETLARLAVAVESPLPVR